MSAGLNTVTAGRRALSYNNDISFAILCFSTSAFIRKLQLNPDPRRLPRILTRTCTGAGCILWWSWMHFVPVGNIKFLQDLFCQNFYTAQDIPPRNAIFRSWFTRGSCRNSVTAYWFEKSASCIEWFFACNWTHSIFLSPTSMETEENVYR